MQRLLPLVFLASACAAPDAAPDRHAYAKIVIEDEDCPSTGCGVNAGFVIGSYFGELHWKHLANPQGVKFVDFANLPPGTNKLIVKTNRFVAVGPFGASAENAALEGSTLNVQVEGAIYPVKISKVHRKSQYWAKKENDIVETYKFEYQPLPVTVWKPLCLAEPTVSSELQYDAVVFDKERFDADDKTIFAEPDTNWFNIACLSGAAGKTFMMRHTIASSKAPTVATSGDERQALVDAWTANYCGNGHSFTETGTHLLLRDSYKWIATSSLWSWADESEITSYEAVWGPDGAVCMNEPRFYIDDEEAEQQIRDYCLEVRGTPLPHCSDIEDDLDIPVKWMDDGHILTANY